MNLLLKREEIKSCQSGAELLRNKRDVLLREFFACLKPLMALREVLDNQSSEASRALVFALGLEGREKLNSLAFIKPKPPSLKISYKNLLGIKIPQVLMESDIERGEEPTPIDTGLLTEEVKFAFGDFLKLALRILPEELKLKRLGHQIKQTTRKVNSLEKFVIPGIYLEVKFIRETLEEREREDIFRLKRLKKRLQR